MKGIVFTEFLEMVEEKFGYEMVDNIIDEEQLASKGIYTSVGTYSFSEMGFLITQLHERTKISVPDLLHTYGQYLHNTFVASYPQFYARLSSSFDFLESIDGHIHVEVLKLYDDAELPKFKTKRLSDNQLEMLYSSVRKMGPFALGLIEKSIEHFGEKAKIEMNNLKEDGSEVQFLITLI